MSYRILAFHYPKAEHRSEMVERIRRAVDVMAQVPGFISAECWDELGGDTVVAVGSFDTKEAWLAAVQAVQAAEVDFGYDERETRPRLVQEFAAKK